MQSGGELIDFLLGGGPGGGVAGGEASELVGDEFVEAGEDEEDVGRRVGRARGWGGEGLDDLVKGGDVDARGPAGGEESAAEVRRESVGGEGSGDGDFEIGGWNWSASGCARRCGRRGGGRRRGAGWGVVQS